MDKNFEINNLKYEKEKTRAQEKIIEGLWLSYYNDTLFSKGIISKRDHDRMRVLIKNRAA